jgi:hypothetical protein
MFDMGNEARGHDEVRPLAEDLVGDVNVATLGVTGNALHFGSSLHARLLAPSLSKQAHSSHEADARSTGKRAVSMAAG